MFSQKYKNEQARDVYLLNRGTAKGIDMIKANHVKTKDITSDMKLFKEVKESKIISTYFNRIEVLEGNELTVIHL